MMDGQRNLARLRQLAVDGHRTEVRQAAIQEIVAGWPDDPDTLPWLRGYVTGTGGLWNELASEVDHSGWWHPEGTGWHRWIGTDPYGAARRVAIEAIAAGRPDARPDVAQWLREHVADDPEPHVRAAAIRIIATRRAGDRRTLSWLRHIAASSDQARDLGNWANDPQTPALLHDRAANDRYWLIQGAAAKALATRWPDDPQTLPLLRDLTADDHIGLDLCRLIAEGWTDDPGTRPLLHERMVAAHSAYRRAR